MHLKGVNRHILSTIFFLPHVSDLHFDMQTEVSRFLTAVLAGDFKFLRFVVSNRAYLLLIIFVIIVLPGAMYL